jgi:hypothetical protein
MVPKVIRGAGFRGVLNYITRADTQCQGEAAAPRVIAGNMVGRDARQLAAEFKAARQLRPDVKRPVWHCPISLPPGEHLDDSKFAAVLDDFMQEMGFTSLHQWVAVLHRDKDHLHAHVVASRIALDGRLWTGEHEARQAIAACRRLEQKHGLRATVMPGAPAAVLAPHPQQRPVRSVEREQVHKAGRRAERRGTKANNVHAVRVAVHEAVERAADIEELERQLVQRGIEVEFTRRDGRDGGQGEIYGWTLRQRGAEEWLKASSVARDITWPRVQAGLSRRADLRARAQFSAQEANRAAAARAQRLAGGIAGRNARPQDQASARALPPAEAERVTGPLAFLDVEPLAQEAGPAGPAAHLDDVSITSTTTTTAACKEFHDGRPQHQPRRRVAAPHAAPRRRDAGHVLHLLSLSHLAALQNRPQVLLPARARLHLDTGRAASAGGLRWTARGAGGEGGQAMTIQAIQDDLPVQPEALPPPDQLLKLALGRLREDDLRRLRDLAQDMPPIGGDAALMALLRRLLDLCVRVLSLGAVRVPPTQAEREAAARAYLLKEVDVEIDRRAEQTLQTVPAVAPRVIKTFDPRAGANVVTGETGDVDDDAAQSRERNRP